MRWGTVAEPQLVLIRLELRPAQPQPCSTPNSCSAQPWRLALRRLRAKLASWDELEEDGADRLRLTLPRRLELRGECTWTVSRLRSRRRRSRAPGCAPPASLPGRGAPGRRRQGLEHRLIRLASLVSDQQRTVVLGRQPASLTLADSRSGCRASGRSSGPGVGTSPPGESALQPHPETCRRAQQQRQASQTALVRLGSCLRSSAGGDSAIIQRWAR
jgi:hypothetical protein